MHFPNPSSASDTCTSLRFACKACRHPALFRSITKFVGLVFLTHCLVTYEEMPQLVKELMYGESLFACLGWSGLWPEGDPPWL